MNGARGRPRPAADPDLSPHQKNLDVSLQPWLLRPGDVPRIR